jgi:hypothetical protein
MAAPVSARFAELVGGESVQLVSYLEIVDRFGSVIADSSTFNVVGGRVEVDASASFRRWLSGLRLADTTGELVPTTAADWFSPIANNEILVYSGIMVDGVAEYVLQGAFHLEGCETEDTPEGLTLTVGAYDRGRKYARAKRIIPKRFDQSAGLPVYTAISELLTDAYPGTLVYHDTPAALTAEQELTAGTDPWEAARSLAEDMGYELFFDRVGDCRLQKVPDPAVTTSPHWEYREGANATLLAVSRQQSNAEVYNGWVITGENPALGSPVRAVVWDDDPASPTYWLGPYGKVPGFYQSDKVRTVAQAIDAGTGKLNKNRGVPESVQFTITPNPALEPRDFVKLVRARSKFPESGPGSEPLVVDSFSVPLTTADGAMTVRCRQRRLA